MSNPFNKNRARKSFNIKEIKDFDIFKRFCDKYKPFGIRRETAFIDELNKLILEFISIGYEEGTSGKAELSARKLGKRGGEKGGPARAKKLSPERRKEIAKLAADTRWKNV